MSSIHPKLRVLVQEVRTGNRELNADTAREIMRQTTVDHRSKDSEEVTLLQGLDQSAPTGSVYGRELIKAFVEGSQSRLRTSRNTGVSETPTTPNESSAMTHWWNTWARMNPYLEAWRVPPPSYTQATIEDPAQASHALTEQSERNARRAVAGEEALQALVQQFDGAWREVGTTQTRMSVNNDVYQVYREQVQKQPINEYDPLAAVEQYLASHYQRK